jgi:hypothetical protein
MYQSSNLWKKLAEDNTLQDTINEIRTVCEALGQQVARLIPQFTDHSVKHMDALWGIADKIFTEK